MFKLTLNRDTHDYFTRSVPADEPGVDAPTIQSQVRLSEADQYLDNHLEDQRNGLDDYETWLFDLFERVTNQVKLTLYNVSEQSDVGVIFETMNDRGRELTDLEEVENFPPLRGVKTRARRGGVCRVGEHRLERHPRKHDAGPPDG
jgi:hypothetical protein